MKEDITIGMDLGDEKHRVCVVDGVGEVVEERTIGSTERGTRNWLARYRGAVVAMENGTHSRWVSQVAEEEGLKVLVGNARKLRMIWASRQKSDVRDAEMLARIARLDPKLLYPVRHRSKGAQEDLAILKARDRLVQARVDLINHTRGIAKSFGERLARCSAESFHRKAQVPERLKPALGPLLETIGELTRQIRCFDTKIEEVAERYPQTGRMTQVPGVGTLTALAYELTLEEAGRFAESRTVGAYLGLVPKRDQSGSTDKQLRITKEGDGYLRRLLVGCSHYILGPFGPACDLRRYGQRLMERGGKNAKKRAVVAVARKLAVLLHALWRTGAVYEPDRQLRRAA